MPFEIKLDMLPGGYSAASGRRGEQIPVITREFTSSEDGNLFISRLEGMPRNLLSKLPGIRINAEAALDHLFAIIRPDGATTVYLNDLPYTILARAKRTIKAGDPVMSDHILDVTKVKLTGITVPPEAGVMSVFSSGWRKGFYFDVGPIFGDRVPRTYDIESVLGQYYAYLSYQHVFSMPDQVWDVFFHQSWFPFIHLNRATLRDMINWAESGYALDDKLDTVVVEVKESMSASLLGWKSRSIFSDHHELISTAFRKYSEDDFISATAILFPRIEGILRANHFSIQGAPAASQDNLVASTFSRAQLPGHDNSLLLPKRFQRYLEEIFFASFDPKNPQGLNRNTVAHGVAPQTAFNRKGATLGFLILLQLAALLPNDNQAGMPS